MGYSRSRAKCVPLQYPWSATRGVKQAPYVNRPSLNENRIAVSTPLQEKINILDKALDFANKESIDQVSQSGSGMFYELLNRRMECEKYQDCSWFQQSLLKSGCNIKLSQAETLDSVIDADEFNMSMQCAEAPISLWGDEYLEVFTDDILEENFRLGEEDKNSINISNEKSYNNCKGTDDFDSNNVNFSLKKTDSMDSMKNISLTDPCEVIPSTFKERLNNLNYELIKLGGIKNEVKQELHSPGTNLHLICSDDSDLNIGREEEVSNVEDAKMVVKKETLNLDQIKSEIFIDKVPTEWNTINHQVKENSGKSNCRKVTLPVKSELDTTNNQKAEKLDLNFDIPKYSFEQSLNMPTPDLDFMDLVDFINDELRQENNSTSNLTPNSAFRARDTNQDLILTENKEEIIQPNGIKPPQVLLPARNQTFLNLTEIETSNNFLTKDVQNSSIAVVCDSGVSIAERIKTGAKRRTRKNVEDLIDSEDDEDFGSSAEDYDYKDDDYDCREDLVKRKFSPLKKRPKLSSVESTLDGRREGVDSYREKRDKNNEASRRSRQNRKAREKHMYETLNDEERRNLKLKAEAEVLDKQVTSLRQLLLQVVLCKGGAT